MRRRARSTSRHQLCTAGIRCSAPPSPSTTSRSCAPVLRISRTRPSRRPASSSTSQPISWKAQYSPSGSSASAAGSIQTPAPRSSSAAERSAIPSSSSSTSPGRPARASTTAWRRAASALSPRKSSRAPLSPSAPPSSQRTRRRPRRPCAPTTRPASSRGGMAVARGSVDDVEPAARSTARGSQYRAHRLGHAPLTADHPPAVGGRRLQLEPPSALELAHPHVIGGRHDPLHHDLAQIRGRALGGHLARSRRRLPPPRPPHQRLHAGRELGAASLPLRDPLGLDHQLFRIFARVVAAEQLERAALALAAFVDRDDPVVRAVLPARARESDLDHASRRPPCPFRETHRGAAGPPHEAGAGQNVAREARRPLWGGQ